MGARGLAALLDRILGIPLVAALGLLDRLVLKALGIRHRPLKDGDRVLVAKLRGGLGEALLLLPLLKALRQMVGPQGRIEVVATLANRDALEGCPWVDGVLVLDVPRVFREPWFGWLFFKGLRSRSYTHALDMDLGGRFTPLACLAAGAPRIYGFKAPGQQRHGLYLLRAPLAPGRHLFEQLKDVAALAGLDRRRVEAWPGFLERSLKAWKGGPQALPKAPPKAYVVLVPGCGPGGWQRAWPEPRWAALIQALAGRGWQVVLAGQGEHERALTARLAKPGQALDLAGQLGHDGLLRLLRRASLVACGDADALQLAVGLGRPVVALHGPSDPAFSGPCLPGPRPRGAAPAVALWANLACSPCFAAPASYGCAGRACIEALEPWQAEQACWAALPQGGRA